MDIVYNHNLSCKIIDQNLGKLYTIIMNNSRASNPFGCSIYFLIYGGNNYDKQIFQLRNVRIHH